MHVPDDRLWEGVDDPGDRLFAQPVDPPQRRGFAPPLLAGLAAAVLFAFAVGFFLVPSSSVGDPAETRTRWNGTVRVESPVQRLAPTTAVLTDSAMIGIRPEPGRESDPVLAPAGAAATMPGESAAPVALVQPSQAQGGSGTGIVGVTPAAAVGAANPQSLPVGASQVKVIKPDPVAARVQALLNGFGYQAGPADGLAGPMTWSAIEQFRLDRGLALDTPLTLALVDQLEAAREQGWRPPLAADVGPFASKTESAAVPGEPVPDRTLQRVPGLRAMAPPERHVLERWCTSGRNAADLEGYYRCLSETLQQLAAEPALPELAGFDANRLEVMRKDCQHGPHATEPNAYFECLRRAIATLSPVDADATQTPIGAPRTVAPVMLGERSG
ncbi:MAG: peptidoglycan-binding domain-containing protein [Burkholderiaceae bacterium]